MSNVLFLGMPSHGHIHPTLGLVAELVGRGEKVHYFASEVFRKKIEAAGATCYTYKDDLDIFKGAGKPGQGGGLLSVIHKASSVIADILLQTSNIQFDYLIHSAAFPFTSLIVQLLNIPSVSSLAVFMGLERFQAAALAGLPEQAQLDYDQVVKQLQMTYPVTLPPNPLALMLHNSPLKLVYTSRFFAPDSAYLDNSCRFVGPPYYERQEELTFPFERLTGQRVLYISLGTVFGIYDINLYKLFRDAFADWQGIVVLVAHGVDLTNMEFPEHFIIRDYVPQNALLKYTDVAITHGGMNSMSDLISQEVPFVCLPLGADQPLLAARAAELGATLTLDVRQLTAEQLKNAVKEVVNNLIFLINIKKINESFRSAGGYAKAVDEIFYFKAAREIY